MKKITILILAMIFAFGPIVEPALAYAGAHVKPQCQHECAIPDVGNDTDDQYISRTSIDGNGTSLGEIFDTENFDLDVEDDQKEYQGWNAINATTTFTASYVASYSAYTQFFGYYLNGDLNSFVPLFTSASSTGTTVTVEAPGPTVIGFAIKTGPNAAGSIVYASHNALNANGEDHMVAYDLADNTFILGFEDLPMSSSDKDFNDIVVKITVAPCNNNGGPTTPPANTPPVLTVIGANPLQIVEGTVFTDPGATSTDAEDGDLTSSIVVTGSVNASTTGSYTLTYTVSDSQGATVSANRIVNVVPRPANTAPVITLKGANPVSITVNTPFVDQGATSTDAEDGDLTSSIVVTGSVNNAATGTYTLVYTVTDSGNLSASTTRIVNVVPAGNNGGPTNTPPKITLVGSNPFNVATDTAFIDPGATSTDAEDGDLTSSIVVTGSVNASTTGSYTLTYSVTDSGGLSTSTVRIVNIISTSTTTPPTNPPSNNGGGGNGGGGGRSGRRHDIGGAVLGATTCTYLEDYLRRDWNNNPTEVMKLQSFLNIFEKETLAVNGTFDQATFDATSRFQNKYKSDILTPWGHTAPTGFVYILTKKKVNEIYCNTQIALTVDQQNEIAAFRAFLEGVPAGTTPTQDGLPIDLGDYVGVGEDNDNGFSVGGVANNVASTVKDTVADITNSTGLKNLAVSLLGSPKGLKEISSTYLLILIGLILIAAFAPRKGDKNSITAVKTDASATLTPSAVVEAPKAEDFEQPAPLAEEKTEEKKDDEGSSQDKGFKGIIG